MPRYTYECKKCGEVFDFLILPGRDEVPKCPKCKSKELEKLATCANLGPDVGKAGI